MTPTTSSQRCAVVTLPRDDLAQRPGEPLGYGGTAPLSALGRTNSGRWISCNHRGANGYGAGMAFASLPTLFDGSTEGSAGKLGVWPHAIIAHHLVPADQARKKHRSRYQARPVESFKAPKRLHQFPTPGGSLPVVLTGDNLRSPDYRGFRGELNTGLIFYWTSPACRSAMLDIAESVAVIENSVAVIETRAARGVTSLSGLFSSSVRICQDAPENISKHVHSFVSPRSIQLGERRHVFSFTQKVCS